MQLRLVRSASELREVAKLRYTVYVDEMGKRPVAANHEAKTLLDDLDDVSDVYAFFVNECPVVTGRITHLDRLPPGSVWRSFYGTDSFPGEDKQKVILSKLVSRSDYRGSPAVLALQALGLSECRAVGVEFCFLHSAPELVSYYDLLGCRPYAPALRDPDAGIRVPMVQVLGDHQRFDRVRSPLRALVKRYPASPELVSRYRYLDQKAIALRLTDYIKTASGKATMAALQDAIDLGSWEERVARNYQKGCTVLSISAGTELLCPEERPSYLFVVLEGNVELQPISGLHRQVFPGNWFGHPFLGRSPRLGRAVATTDCVIACTHKAALPLLTETGEVVHL
jgi:hypothetical protein